MKYSTELEFIRATVQKAYNLIGNKKPGKIEQKSEFDLVTNIDYEMEQFLIQAIRSKFPSDNFHSEEFNSKNSIHGRSWIIDPIDGTCNFSNGLPLHGIQCALTIDKEAVLSYIFLPTFNEEFFAITTEGAYLNGKRIFTNTCCQPSNAIISFGDYSHTDKSNAMLQHRAIELIYDQVAKLRIFGAACIDFTFAASGRIHGCALLTKNMWDILPGILLCKESGCIVSDITGAEHSSDAQGVIIASTPQLHQIIVSSFAQGK